MGVDDAVPRPVPVRPDRRRVSPAMRIPSEPVNGGEDQDRVVSRRVDNPTTAAPGDADVYRAAAPAAEPDADRDTGGGGGTAERAGRDLDTDDESGPTRSE